MRDLASFRAARLEMNRVGFVPTMGAFHEGHLELMRRARRFNDQVIVSIFVNPLQFGPNEDFSKYPRQEDQDLEMAKSVGVDAIFTPSAEEFTPKSTTLVTVGEVSERWEGAERPGHFAGVATIVTKLLHVVKPSVTYFGLKDLQQCAVIKRLVRDLNIDAELDFVEVVRDHDGLALSSRNVYLSANERKLATDFPRELGQLRNNLTLGKSVDPLMIKASRDRLESRGIKVDYLALVDADSLEESPILRDSDRIMGAVRIGKVRLLDNISVFSSSKTL